MKIWKKPLSRKDSSKNRCPGTEVQKPLSRKDSSKTAVPERQLKKPAYGSQLRSEEQVSRTPDILICRIY